MSGVAAAFWSAAMGYTIVLVLVTLVWISSPQGSSTMGTALRASGLTWLAANLTPVYLDGSELSLLPTGFALLPLGITAWATRWAWRRHRHAPAPLPRWQMPVAMVSTYSALCVAAGLASGQGSTIDPTQAAIHGALIAGAGCLIGMNPGRLTPNAAFGLVTRTVLLSLAGLFTAGAIAFTLALAAHANHVVEALHAVNSDPGGPIAVTAISLLALPDAAVWAASVLSGPGLSIGADSSVTLFGVAPSTLPPVPIFAALPASMFAWAPALLAIPVLVGAGAGWSALREAPRLSRDGTTILKFATIVGAAVALAGMLAAWGSGGALGGGRYEHIGPPALGAGLAAGGLVGCGIAASLVVGMLKRKKSRAVIDLTDATRGGQPTEGGGDS